MGCGKRVRTVRYFDSQACERNREPILRILRDAFAHVRSVLEIGSGTGQHAVYFAAHLPALIWQPSDTPEYLPLLRERVQAEGGANLRKPIELDVRAWPRLEPFDALFSANTLHIMGWGAVQDFFRGVGGTLRAPGVLCVYGPFRYAGRFTTESNAAFDAALRERDPQSGIRDFEAVNALARTAGLALGADHAMPANNQLLIWHRLAGEAAPAVPIGQR